MASPTTSGPWATTRVLVLLCCGAFLCGCVAPQTFVKTAAPGWNTIEVRDDITYEGAWRSVVDLIGRKFDIEILSKEDGYLRTGWYFAWTGELQEGYKVRGILKFSPDRKTLEVKSEAQFFRRGMFGGGGWVLGTDERLSTTLRTDVMGTVGRVSR